MNHYFFILVTYTKLKIVMEFGNPLQVDNMKIKILESFKYNLIQ